jgi:hypothetical protein
MQMRSSSRAMDTVGFALRLILWQSEQGRMVHDQKLVPQSLPGRPVVLARACIKRGLHKKNIKEHRKDKKESDPNGTLQSTALYALWALQSSDTGCMCSIKSARGGKRWNRAAPSLTRA